MDDNLTDVKEFERPLLLDMPTQVVAFELSLPRVFSGWRDITYMILCNIGLKSDSHSRPQSRPLSPRPLSISSDWRTLTLGDFHILRSLVAERWGDPP